MIGRRWLDYAVAFSIAAVVVSTISRLPAAQVGGGTNSDTGAVVALSAQPAGTVFSADQINSSARAAKCAVTLTSVTGTVTVTIYGKDGTSGAYYTLLASTALNSAGQTILTVGPGLTQSNNSVANDYLPFLWRVGAAVATGPASGTVGCSTIG